MEKIKVKQTLQPNKSPRNLFIAFFLSLIFPGLGQVYNGQPKKAVAFFMLLLFFPLIFGLSRSTTLFYGFTTLLLIEVIVAIFIIIDSVRHARLQKEYIPKNYNTWYYYFLIAIAMYSVLLFFDTRSVLGIQTFNLPSPSNNPTFQVGDKVVADMKIYKNTKIGYGDIVVFNSPEGQIWTFRVVGLPNDKLEINDNIVTINGNHSKAIFIKETIDNDVPVIEFTEELFNGHQHKIYKFKQTYDPTKTTIKDIVVPADCYYLLGDNRDNAVDSRYIGCVKRQDILGKIIYSYWGKTIDRINIDFRDK